MKRIKFSQHNKTNYITCQNNNLKSVHADYIYHKNEIGKSCEMSLPILKKRYHTNFYRHDIYIFIAVTCNSVPRHRCWRYLKNFEAS